MQYDFKSISSYDFELLIRDLLQKELKQKLETFKPGRDSGVDIRLSVNKKNTIIVQCKHYANSKYNNLLISLRGEKVKIDKLKPGRYIIATSLGLTPDNKNEIQEIFGDYIKEYSDIIDLDGINNLIRKYPEVEKAHYKLWMTSTEIMRLILHSSVYNRSKIDENAIEKKAKVYVQNPSYGKALKILGKNHYCIISGIPGIGKTTLAEILCLKYLSRNYEFVSISASIDDAYSLLDERSKQVFLFDDFLGSIFFEDKLKDDALLKFIEHIETSKNKRFILTTREYILNQAFNSSEGYARAKLKKCIIQQDEYSKRIKAQILYNHLYFSGLEDNYFNALINEKKYYAIINHPNYTPRIIEWMTNALNVRNISAEKYTDEFVNALNNPKIIWKIAFEKHLSQYSRSIIILLGLLYDTVVLDDFVALLKEWDKQSIGVVEWNILYKNSLKELDGTFIRIEKHSSDLLKFHNPSVKDFVLEYISLNSEIIDSFIEKNLIYWDQFCSVIKIINKNNRVLLGKVIKILDKMIDQIDFQTIEVEYVFSDSIRKKRKNLFSRVRFIFETTEALKIDLSEDMIGKLTELVKYETTIGFTANYDSWYVYSKIIKIKGKEAFENESKLIHEKLLSAETHEELNEFYDMYSLFNKNNEEYDEEAKERFNEILDDCYLDDDLYSLKKAEENATEFIEKLNIDSPYKLNRMREKIDELELEENESDNEFDDNAKSSILEKQKSEKIEIETIDDMFQNLKERG